MEEVNKDTELNDIDKKLHIFDVSDRYSLEDAKKFAMEIFNSNEMKCKFPRGGWVKVDDVLSVLMVGIECGYKFGRKSNKH